MRALAVVPVVALLLAACGSPAEPDLSGLQGLPELPDRDTWTESVIIATGTPTSISAGRPTIHIASATQGCGTIYTIAAETAIVRLSGDGSLSAASVQDLRVGRSVRIWAVQDIELTSCPAQAMAEAVVLLPGDIFRR